MQDYNKRSLELHKQYKGKLSVSSKVPLGSKDDLSVRYSPGVAAPCLAIAEDPASAYDYTWKGLSVAVVSDGSAVLGLGNIGGLAGLPVMEGKAILMNEFAGINAVPIVLSTQDPDSIISIVESIAPTFGAINLEDIKAPECFYIEESLQRSLSIPVFHDDQHGTAIVVLAGLYNALTVVGKELGSVRVTIIGAGAAGIATALLLHEAGCTNIRMVDSQGVIRSDRPGINPYKARAAAFNTDQVSGTLDDALKGADVVIGVSQPNCISVDQIGMMNDNPIVFALSNPLPEITYDDALAAGAAVYASGRSDLPNQVNNLLVFPGLLRGALDARIPQITMHHKLVCAKALAALVENPTADMVLPSALDKSVAPHIAQAIVNA